MKALKKLIILALATMSILALMGCELYNEINLAWTINSYQNNFDGTATVFYTVENLGRHDLTGVNLEFALDSDDDGLYEGTAWTYDFSIGIYDSQNREVDIPFTGAYTTPHADVIGVDMDNPKD